MIDIFGTIPTNVTDTATLVENSVGKSLANFSDAQNFLNNTVNNLITPQVAPGINGWIFDVRKTEQVDLEADIADHYMEDNSFTNDHVIIKPEIITLTGFVGELVSRKPLLINAILSFLENKLTTVSEFTGEYSSQAAQEILKVVSQTESYINTINQTIDKTKDIIKQFKSQGAFETAIQEAYNDLKAFMTSSDLLTVQTPFGIHKNMKIIKISMVNPEDSEDYADISITLKEMRFTTIKFTLFDNKLFKNRNLMQKSEMQDQGKLFGKSDSMIFSLTEAVKK